MNTKPSLKSVDISIPMPWGPIAGRTYGDEQKMPVLCVHGRQDNLETFCYLLPLLPRNFYYVCIDLPNHGKSAHAEKGYIVDLLWYAMCTKRVIDHYGWSKLYFLGHSLGGQIGFILVALYPELFLKLVIIDTLMYSHVIPSFSTPRAIRDFTFDPTLKFENRNSFDEAPIYSLTEFAERMRKARRTEVRLEHILPITERNLTQVGPDQYKYSNDQRTKVIGPLFLSFEKLEEIGNEIKCPTLVLLGKSSLNTEPLAKSSRTPLQSNKNVILKVIEGDHDLHIVHAQEVAKEIGYFLSAETVSKL